MNYFPLIADAAAVLIFLLSALRGRKRGLIKTLAGILSFVLAFSISGFLAKQATPYISEKYVSPYISSVVLPEAENLSEEEALENPSAVSDIFLDIGIPESIVADAISDFTSAMTKSIIEPIAAMTNSVAYKITHSVLFVIFFLLSLFVLSLLFKLLNLAAKIPGINFINKTLGLILGIVLGYLIIIALSYILLKTGTFLTDDIVSETYILKHIMSFSPKALF